MDYYIRPAQPSDEAFLWQMLYEAAHMSNAGETIETAKTNSNLARYVANWGLPDDVGFIAETKNHRQPVAAVWMRLLTGENKGYGYVNDSMPELAVGVLPGHRGKGIGCILLDRLLDEAARKYPGVCLSVRANNPAVRFYERAEFQAVFGSEVVNRVGTVSYTMLIEFE
jgi:ribosomal protein S18 acetylase RimI-like enzyme